MAQHIPIDAYQQKAMKKIAEGIRKRESFGGSLMYEELRDKDYKETEEDKVYITERTVPVSIYAYGRATIEVHTEPVRNRPSYIRRATNIYLVA